MTPFRIGTPDGIRTRATALRDRSRSNRQLLRIDEDAGQEAVARMVRQPLGRLGPLEVRTVGAEGLLGRSGLVQASR